MSVYEVGKPYISGRTRWPEIVEYNYRAGAHELRMFIASPSIEEARDVTRGDAEFALAVHGDIIFFMYRFGRSFDWSDAPYSWHLVRLNPETADEAVLPEPTHLVEPHDLIQVILVDARTGIVKGLRLVTFSPAFTTAIRQAIREQAEKPWPGHGAYDAQLAAVYRQYPSSRQLLRTATARTRAGT